MALSKSTVEKLVEYVESLPDGTVIARASTDDADGYELVAAFREDSHFDQDWIGLYGNGASDRVSTDLVAHLLEHVDPLAATRIAFGALEAVHGDDAPRIEVGQTYIRRTHDDSFAVRVAETEMGTAAGDRLPLTFKVPDPLAKVERVTGYTVDPFSGLRERGTFLLLGDGSGRRVNVHDGTIVDHSEIKGARAAHCSGKT